MIISDKHRYLFIELPHTGSTAIAKELCELYDGTPILRKHDKYHDFLRIADPEQKKYYVFSGIRNPLDDAVSVYFRHKNNKGNVFTDPEKVYEKGGWVRSINLEQYHFITSNDADFPTYFRRYFRKPYDNSSCLYHRRFDHIIRFENILEDFEIVIRQIGLEPVRPLPVVNRTANRSSDIGDYYDRSIWPQARYVFGPFMKEWGYEFPPEWDDTSVPLRSQVIFRLIRSARKIYWRWFRWPAGPFMKRISGILESARRRF